jgi:hypothetical protein
MPLHHSFIDYLLNDDDSEDENADMTTVLLLSALPHALNNSRQSFYVRNRLEWNAHVSELFDEGPLAFYKLYRMDFASFNKLCSLINPFVIVDSVMSTR